MKSKRAMKGVKRMSKKELAKVSGGVGRSGRLAGRAASGGMAAGQMASMAGAVKEVVGDWGRGMKNVLQADAQFIRHPSRRTAANVVKTSVGQMRKGFNVAQYLPVGR